MYYNYNGDEMKNEIKEAVIIVGGMGTRLLPYTKTVSKEMMPIFDVPSVFLLVKEAYLSGIKKIIFVVTKRNKNLIQNFFTKDNYLNNFIKGESSKEKKVSEINEIIRNMTFNYVYQNERGTYGALYSARKLIRNDNFIVMYGDDIMDSDIPLSKQLIDEFYKDKKMYITIKKYPSNELPPSGLIKVDDNNYLMGIVKKKDSSYANLLGRYLLNKKIFTVKNKLKYYANNELYLPHALLNFNGEVKAVWYNDEYFNIGEKLGFIKASIHYGLKNNDYKEELINYLKSVNKKLK